MKNKKEFTLIQKRLLENRDKMKEVDKQYFMRMIDEKTWKTLAAKHKSETVKLKARLLELEK